MPVVVGREELDIVGKTFADRNDRAAFELGEQRVIGEDKLVADRLTRAVIVGKDQSPSSNVEIVVNDYELELIATIAGNRAQGCVATDDCVGCRDSIPFVEHHRRRRYLPCSRRR